MKAVILDMYGVIIKQTGDDFVPYIQRTFPVLRPEDIYEPWFKADLGELTSIEVWEHLGFRGDIEKIEREYLDTLEINHDFYSFASAIRKNYKIALISNDSSRWSTYLRKKYDINSFFDVISISGDLNMQKPDARIFQHTLAKLNCEPKDCLYVDDREGNLIAASKIGMHTVLFNSRNILYKGDSVTNFTQLANILQSNFFFQN